MVVFDWRPPPSLCIDCLGMPRSRWRRACCHLFQDSNTEVARLKRNWMIVHGTSFALGLSFAISYPSLHQFVTTPRDVAPSSTIRPGLGLDEKFYAWTVSVYGIGELLFALVFAVAVKVVRVKLVTLFGLLCVIVGSVVYGLASAGWMVIVGRFLQGAFLGGQSTLMRIYLGETSNVAIGMKGEDPRRSQIKNINFLISFGVGTTAIAIGPGIAAVVAQFPSIDPFRWSGWFLVIYCLFLLVLNWLFFVERYSDINRKRTTLSLRSIKPAIPFYSIAYIVGAFFIINFGFSMIEALVNPFLGDNFGLNIEYISYIFCVILFLFLTANVTTYLFQRLGMSNKNICLLGMFMGICGSVIIADWQSVRGDPCDQYSYGRLKAEYTNLTSSDSCGGGSEASTGSCWYVSCNDSTIRGPSNCTTLVSVAIESCRNHSGPPDECFWNQYSRLTGVYCEECEKLCRSERTSLNFVQLLIGLAVFSPAFPYCRITMSILASDAMGKEGQSFLMGIIVASGALSKILGPLWGDALMLAAGRRTYLAMSVLAAMLAVTFVVYILLYRKLSPPRRALTSEADSSDSSDEEVVSLQVMVNGGCKVGMEVKKEEEEEGITEEEEEEGVTEEEEEEERVTEEEEEEERVTEEEEEEVEGGSEGQSEEYSTLL